MTRRLVSVLFFALTYLNIVLSAGDPLLPKIVVTNVDVQPDADGKVRFNANTKASRCGKASILLDIKKKGDGFEAKLINNSTLKRSLKEDVRSIQRGWFGGNAHVLLCVHGFNVPPESWLETCAKYRDKCKRPIIPVIWACEDVGLWGYHRDRVLNAPGAADAFRTLLDTVTDFRKSILCHSMGNFVLSLAAKAGCNVPFEDIFMVAADVRWDVFDKLKNDSGNRSDNDGLEIAALAKRKVHVMYCNRDLAMIGRRLSADNKLSPALGANGFRESELHPSLKGKVVNVDCSSKSEGEGLTGSSFFDVLVHHGYYFKNKMVDYYEAVMNGNLR